MFNLSRRISRWWSPSNRGFTSATLLCFALGGGVVIAIAQVLFAMQWRQIGVADESELVVVYERNDARGISRFAASIPNFESWREWQDAFRGVVALSERGATMSIGGESRRLAATTVSPEYWRVLGQPLLEGQGFVASDIDSADKVVLSESLWRQMFNAKHDVIGSRMTIDGRPRTVVGIARESITFGARADIWLPLERFEGFDDRGDRRHTVVARLAPGRTAVQTQAAIEPLARELAVRFPESNEGWSAELVPLREALIGAAMQQHGKLLALAATLILLVVAVSIANLQIARQAATQHEQALRQAVGASRSTLLRQGLVDFIALASVGGIFAVGIAQLALGIISALTPAELDPMRLLTPNLLLATMFALPLTAIICLPAVVPLFVDSTLNRLDLTGMRNTASRSAMRARSTLVSMQFALAALLSITASALAARYADLLSQPLGYRPEALYVATIDHPEVTTQEMHVRQLTAFRQWMEEMRETPGVKSVAISNALPMQSFDTRQMTYLLGNANGATPSRAASFRIVSDGYLATLGLTLLHGRDFTRAEHVADEGLISADLAEALGIPGDNAIDRTVMLENGRKFRVIGVVAPARQRDVAAAPTPTIYVPTGWWLWPTMSLAVRTEAGATSPLPAMRAAASRAFPSQLLYGEETMTDRFAANISLPLTQATILGMLAFASILVACVGAASVLAYMIGLQRRELAIRMAVGATASHVQRSILMRGLRVVVPGIVGGSLLVPVLAPLVVARLGEGALVLDIGTLSVTVGALLASGILVLWLVTHRNAIIAPASCMRGD